MLATAKWVCEELIGRERQLLFNSSTQARRDGEERPHASAGASQGYELAVQPQDLFKLATGADGVVQCLWFAPGKPWAYLTIKRV